MKTNESLLIEYAKTYNIKEFIETDPIQFPHHYQDKKDIEISAFISSWLAYGNRKAILKTLGDIHKEFDNTDYLSPFNYIKERGFERYRGDEKSLYRFYKNKDFYNLCQTLFTIYIEEKNQSLEDKIEKQIKKENQSDNPCLDVINAIILIFKEVEGIPINNTSACKRLCMLLRWLVRNDNIVDLGIWTIIEPKDLIIPVDTHVHRQALRLGLTFSKQANMKTAIEITNNIKTIFPLDPGLADFSLFGYGVNNPK